MMHNLSEQIDEAMRVLTSLSNSAKTVGSDSVYYAANRAWWELYAMKDPKGAARAKAEQEPSDAR